MLTNAYLLATFKYFSIYSKRPSLLQLQRTECVRSAKLRSPAACLREPDDVSAVTGLRLLSSDCGEGEATVGPRLHWHCGSAELKLDSCCHLLANWQNLSAESG